jgi:hypothetical protein
MKIYITKKYLIISIISFLIAAFLISLFISANAFAEVTYEIDSHNPTLNLDKINTSIKRTCGLVLKVMHLEEFDLDIKIYFVKDYAELSAKCPIRIGKTPVAYYIPATNTIYMLKYTRAVFAHELTHAMLDKYFGKSFPHEIQEIIPQYVEKTMRKIY